MNKKVLIHHATGLRTIRMVRQLILLGFVIGLISALSFVWYLFKMRDANAQLEHFQDHFSQVSSSLSLVLTEAHRDFEQLFNLPLDEMPQMKADWQQKLIDVSTQLTQRELGDFAGIRQNELHVTILDVIDLRSQLTQTHVQILNVSHDSQKQYAMVHAMLGQLRETVGIIQGRCQLEHAAMIYRFLDHEQDQTLGEAIRVIDHTRDSFSNNGLEAEFSELAMHLEQLYGAQDIALLADLKSNRFLDIFNRLHQITTNLTIQQWTMDFETQVDHFRQSILGPNNLSEHPDLSDQPENNSLFALIQRRIELQQKRRAINNSIDFNINLLYRIQADLALQTRLFTEHVWGQFEIQGKHNFIKTSVVMTCCWGTFFVLAMFIHKSVTQQVKQQQQTEEDLHQQIHERIEAQEQSQKLHQKLIQSHKLESMGQLAAGIAHEINTPSQYVGDNARFLKDSFVSLKKLHDMNSQLIEKARHSTEMFATVQEIESTMALLDADYLWEEIPHAIDQSLDGIKRVSDIVQSMQLFAHKGNGQKIHYDINKAVTSSLTLSRNEWKYIAQVHTELAGDLPLVPVYASEINQVVLNMIINGVHAIAQRQQEDTLHQGLITLRTRLVDDTVQIIIQDNGQGIAPEIRDRIFDPFFTTKPVGKGTGQGLALAYGSVVENHKGQIQLESQVGQGSTFTISLPVLESSNPLTHLPAPA
jgi:signal transduction histidine kinase